jgi:hypothetical protein
VEGVRAGYFWGLLDFAVAASRDFFSLSRRTLHLSSSAALLVWSSVAPPSQAQLPLFAPDGAAEPAVESPPAADPAPPEAPLAPTSTPPAAASSSTALAPAKVEAIGFGEHPYDDDEDDDPTELAPRRTWYGWQTLVVDGAALSALLAGAAVNRGASSGSEGSVVAVVGLLTYELGPGIVHFVHRNPGRGFASFGVRLGMPLTGAFLGASFSSNCDSYRCEDDGAAAGALLGMVGAIAIDAAVFAYDDRRSRASHARPRFVPLASFQPGRAWVGLGGEL